MSRVKTAKAVLNSFQIAVGDACQSSSGMNMCWAEGNGVKMQIHSLCLANNGAEEKRWEKNDDQIVFSHSQPSLSIMNCFIQTDNKTAFYRNVNFQIGTYRNPVTQDRTRCVKNPTCNAFVLPLFSLSADIFSQFHTLHMICHFKANDVILSS